MESEASSGPIEDFKLGGVSFGIDSAVFWGEITHFDHLDWAISIRAKKGRIVGEIVSPRAYSPGLFIHPVGRNSELRSAINCTMKWQSCHAPGHSSPLATLYVFEHLDIYDSFVSLKWDGGKTVTCLWSGFCDLYLGSKFDREVKLDVNCSIRFLGFRVAAEHFKNAKDLLGAIFPKLKFSGIGQSARYLYLFPECALSPPDNVLNVIPG